MTPRGIFDRKKGYTQELQISRPEMKVYGVYIRRLRKNADITLSEMAYQLEVSRVTLSAWERGIHVPNIEIGLIVEMVEEVIKRKKEGRL